MPPSDKRIPIVALCGFLGAGKTTTLNHILREENGRKIAVIVNDFGSINVDSMLITSQTENTMRLSNGAICCATGEDSVEEVIERLAHKHSIIELIIIEASGAAEPSHMAYALSKLRNRYTKFDSLVYVVDGAEFKQTAEEHPDLPKHLEIADCIILNKVDSISEKQRKELRTVIEFASPEALVLESSFGKIDTGLLLGFIKDENRQRQLQLLAGHDDEDDHHHHEHIHDAMVTNTIELKSPLDPELLFQLLDNPPRGIYRLKGWVDFGMKGMGQTFIIQMVGRRWRMHLYKDSRILEDSQLLVIGSKKLNMDDLKKRLDSCIDKNPDDVTAKTMVDVFKYDTEY